MATKSVYTEVEISLDDFDDDELLDELAERGIGRDGAEIGDFREALTKLYEAKKYGLGDFELILAEECLRLLGKNL